MRSIEEGIAAALAEHVPLGAPELADLIELPPNQELGDYALPCFALARVMRKAPQQIAAGLAGQVALPEGVTGVSAEGAYLNFRLDRPAACRRVLAEIRRLGERYGSDDAGVGRTVVVEFSSPNIAKHLGVHHLPGTLIGRALCRLYGALGYRVEAVNFLGDWGTGFGKLVAAVERYGVEDPDRLTVGDLMDLYIRFSKEADEQPELQQAARDAGRRLEQGEARARACWQAFKAVSLREFERIYALLDVRFDHYMPESLYVDRLGGVLERLAGQGVAVESEGALVVEFGDEMPALLVRRSDGTSLYAARDIAAAEARWERFHFDRSIYVVGNEQSLYFNQLKATLKRMGHDWAERMVHVSFGLIKFRDPETGIARVGSTRRGEIVLLEDVLNEAVGQARRKIEQNVARLDAEADLDALAAQVGLGAVVFAELSARRMRDAVFDWDRILDFEGDTGPYVQYAHARLCSIMRKAGEAPRDDADAGLLALPEEWALVRHLERFPSAVRHAALQHEPSVVAGYLLDLCADFSSYYSAGMREPERRVLCDDAALRAARLVLVDAARTVIRSGLALLGVAAPERM